MKYNVDKNKILATVSDLISENLFIYRYYLRQTVLRQTVYFNLNGCLEPMPKVAHINLALVGTGRTGTEP